MLPAAPWLERKDDGVPEKRAASHGLALTNKADLRLTPGATRSVESGALGSHSKYGVCYAVAVIRRFFLAAFVWFLLDSTGFIAWQAAGQAGAESATQNAAALLARAKEVMGFARVGQSVVHYQLRRRNGAELPIGSHLPAFFFGHERQRSLV